MIKGNCTLSLTSDNSETAVEGAPLSGIEILFQVFTEQEKSEKLSKKQAIQEMLGTKSTLNNEEDDASVSSDCCEEISQEEAAALWDCLADPSVWDEGNEQQQQQQQKSRNTDCNRE